MTAPLSSYEDLAQRLRWHVPRWDTLLVAGKHYGDRALTGFSVDTSAHGRFHARGPSGSSGVVAQASGQVWLQARSNVVGLAQQSVTAVSNGSVLVAAEGGVSLLAGFAPSKLEWEAAESAGELPSGVESYESSMSTVSTWFTALDTMFALGLTISDVAQTLFDAREVASLVDPGLWLGSAANLAGAAVNIAGLTVTDPDLPGVSMFSQAGTLIGTPMYLNVYAAPGMLLAAGFSTQFGFLSATVMGLVSAGLTSLGSTGVSSLRQVSLKGTETQVAARTGTLEAKGATMRIGDSAAAPPQVPTTRVQLRALTGLSFAAGLLPGAGSQSLTARAKYTSEARETKIVAKTGLEMTAGGFQIAVTAASVGLHPHRKQLPGLRITDQAVELVGSGQTSLKLSGPQAELKALGKGVQIVQGATITIDGTTFDIE